MERDRAANQPSAAGQQPGSVTALSASYADRFWMRAAIQALPLLGGTLDTIASGLGEKLQRERLDAYMEMIAMRLEALEARGFPDAVPSEELCDYVLRMFQHAQRARSEEKREYLANLLARQVTTPAHWDLAEIFADLVSSLSELHLRVLRAVAGAAKVGGDTSLAELKVVRLEIGSEADQELKVTRLADLVPGYTAADLLFVCADLVGRGLLHDEGVNRMGCSGLELVECTGAGYRLLEWISNPVGPDGS